MADDPPSPKRRPRFSLLNLLLMMAVVAMTVVLFRVQVDRSRMQAELDRLHNEVGELSVDDPSQIHVLEVPTPETTTWKWRVHLPKGRRYILHGANKFTLDRVPESEGSSFALPSGGGELLIQVSLRDEDIYVNCAGMRNMWGGLTSFIPPRQLSFGLLTLSETNLQAIERTKSEPSGGFLAVGWNDQQSSDADTDFVLLRYPAEEEDPHDGVMLWLEPSAGK